MQSLLSTNTNLTVFNREGIMRTMDKLIPLYHAGGFERFDLNFCEMMNPHSDLNGPGASSYIERLLEIRESLGIVYHQAHAPYPRRGQDPREWDEKILKAMEYAEALGVKGIVVHPIIGSMKENVDYYSSLIDRTKTGITILLENMETPEEIWSSDQVLEIISHLGGRVKVLLDTGHAHMMGLDLAKEIEAYGDDLLGTHIHDNDGVHDEHLLPGMGNIDWKPVMEAFRKHYKGYLNYEAQAYSKKCSINDTEKIIKEAYSVGLSLLAL